MFCYSLPWRLGDGIFPVRFPVGRNLPGGMGTGNGAVASFAMGAFRAQVAGWSPKGEHRLRFLIDCLALLDCVSWSVNPQVIISHSA